MGWGIVAFEQGDFTTAQAAFQQAVALNPQDALAHFYLGLVYKSTSSPALAVIAFERALGLTSDPALHAQAEACLKELWSLP